MLKRVKRPRIKGGGVHKVDSYITFYLVQRFTMDCDSGHEAEQSPPGSGCRCLIESILLDRVQVLLRLTFPGDLPRQVQPRHRLDCGHTQPLLEWTDIESLDALTLNLPATICHRICRASRRLEHMACKLTSICLCRRCDVFAGIPNACTHCLYSMCNGPPQDLHVVL